MSFQNMNKVNDDSSRKNKKTNKTAARYSECFRSERAAQLQQHTHE